MTAIALLVLSYRQVKQDLLPDRIARLILHIFFLEGGAGAGFGLHT